ncbi:hypothetical protein HAX54_013420 [Datura stramonium]|uniref:Uncharacterized protein n=1 Tax=Datura stramonium TaxID=4076 RepID=A0ABS8RYC6_DATST|nr:hypothetical protein [Datura stramonium]
MTDSSTSQQNHTSLILFLPILRLFLAGVVSRNLNFLPPTLSTLREGDPVFYVYFMIFLPDWDRISWSISQLGMFPK